MTRKDYDDDKDKEDLKDKTKRDTSGYIPDRETARFQLNKIYTDTLYYTSESYLNSISTEQMKQQYSDLKLRGTQCANKLIARFNMLDSLAKENPDGVRQSVIINSSNDDHINDVEDDPSAQHLLRQTLRSTATSTPEKERTFSPLKTESSTAQPPPSTTRLLDASSTEGERAPIKTPRLCDFASKYDSGKCKTYSFDIYKSPQKPKAFEKSKTRPSTRSRRIVKSKDTS